MLLFDFHCDACDLTFEELVKGSRKTLPCPRCKATAKRLIPAPRIDRTAMALRVGATPTAIEHFDRIHRERRAIEDKAYRENGDYGIQPGADSSTGGSAYAPAYPDGARVDPTPPSNAHNP